MADTNFLAGQSSVWVQPTGPNTTPQYLGCHGFDDITEPQGDVTLLYCPDPAQTGKFIVKNSFQSAGGAVTTTITTDIRKTADFLENVRCGVPIFIHKVTCGRRDDFTNWERSFVLRAAKITSKGLSNLAARSPDDEGESLQTFDISAEELIRLYELEASAITLAEIAPITGIAIGGENRCESDCGDQQDFGDIIALTTDASAYLGTANVLLTTVGGTPVATAADPFNVGEAIRGVEIVKVGRSTNRIIVGRGTTDPANPAEIAYSDDNGTTWNYVNVGANNGDFIANAHALYALDARNIWAGTNAGYIYYSEDGGLTWTLQTVAALASVVVGISFYDDSYGFAVVALGTVYRTVDGGATWGAIGDPTAGTATDIAALGRQFAYVAASDGLWYTMDAGTTWLQRNAVNMAAIEFRNELEGLAVGAAASGLIYQTIDGGYTWSALPLVANSGWTDVAWVSNILAYAAGAVNAGAPVYVNLTPAA